VNDDDYSSLFSSLNQAVEILDRNRTPDPGFIAAYDTLKQSRAMIAKALCKAQGTKPASNASLVAA
jgi:hypothetical protein